MKKSKKLIIYITPILLILISAIYFLPKKFYREYSGIMYRLGDSNYSESINVSLDGYLSKRLFKGDKFQGTINIGDRKLDKVILLFSTRDSALVQYFDKSKGEYDFYGDMYSKNLKDKLTICVFGETDAEGSSWNSGDGLMLSAPASSRAEALDISKYLLEIDNLN